MTYKDYLDTFGAADRAVLRMARGERKRKNARCREHNAQLDLLTLLPLLTMPAILTESDNPLVEATCCGLRTSADMLVLMGDGEFACWMCRPSREISVGVG